MKITVQCDDGTEQVFQNIVDAYILVNSEVTKEGDGRLIWTTECKSYSWGGLRTIAKEMNQSLIEIQNQLKENNHARTPAVQ